MDPFDLWLRKSLHQGYDAVTEEPIPEDLLRLASDSRSDWDTIRTRWLARANGRET